MQQYRHNHYVPIFYQQRFMLRGQSRYYRLDLQPETISNRGVKYTRKDFHYWGPANVFAQDDLYTTKLRSTENREIEQFFFGQLDTTGPAAINFICNFDHANQNYNEPLFRQFMTYKPRPARSCMSNTGIGNDASQAAHIVNWLPHCS